MYYKRILEDAVIDSLKRNPVTAVIGPRQCGKSTLVKQLIQNRENALYLDLERPSDLQKLDDAEWFLKSQTGKIVCLDEIQRKPDLFPLLRSLCDEDKRPGKYIILGSASRDLLRQSSETLAGRISYKNLSPFLWKEITAFYNIEDYLFKGGFPQSLLIADDESSLEWRQDFITTFLERDLLQFSGFLPQTMRRLWQMLAHYNGQTANFSALSSSLGVSHTTIRNYVDLLEGTFMVQVLKPWSGNTKKRLVKSPKIYVSDTGIVTALLQLKNFEQIAGHPGFGALWETLVLTNISAHLPHHDFSFYRSSHGAEIDIIISKGNHKIAVECKATVSPQLSSGNYAAIKEINPSKTIVVAPVYDSYEMREGITVVNLGDAIDYLCREMA